MQALTAAILAGFVGYAGAWYLGMVEGNFALLLFLATLVTGAYWVAERLWFLPQRRRAAQALQAQAAEREATLARQGIQAGDGAQVAVARERVLAQPWWLDWTAGLFPVILVVFLLRSFLFEPFKIPSGSMIPTLLVGDLILVNKFTYGLRMPVLNTKITEGREPQRGDVVVFRYPPKPSLDYIKRVVGLPGDEVAYLNKRIFINGQPIERQPIDDFFDRESMRYAKQFEEHLGGKDFRVLVNPQSPGFVPGVEEFPFRDNCRYNVEGVVCKVPPGHYFVMGDNRDNSLDSRFWGFVPDRNLVGKAFLIWMNFGDLGRIGGFE
ncbi:signal peptidase I [Ramlibacter rhizophilus]|uniref:Signal peptidase I n=1 Tax=Ramlibacter rhizophilus TaxID=1781167 RepID=A0A4Z0BDX5_9BURK|nr:signal peptidase I [Ramlibacter rhizophilus]TFY96579.1 signal peptidase I [Ramlibacter rhizophilus]